MAVDPKSSAQKPARPWQEIAEEAAREFDPRRMAELVRELNQAMDEQTLSKPSSEAKPLSPAEGAKTP